MVARSEYVPQRGDAVWLDPNPRAGSEPSGRRPAVVLSPNAYNGKVSLAILCPITNREKGYPFEVAIPAGLDVSGVILADQVKSVDWRARNAELICPLPAKTVDAVLQRVETLLWREERT
ncbi:MAG: type II toxin-antitoxin system PemK/MazF family toxin [Candidatus Poribacteria bacterium]|nr:type II toxin-antitoxin system PemK/MazF family toxin [Candidatus Poribacteria bacterium]